MSCTWLNITLFIRGVSNDSSRTARKRPRNQPCGRVHQDTNCPTTRPRFQRHNTIATLLHTVHIAATTLDSCRIMICMRFARCVHSRTDVKSHHKQRVESPHLACTPFITPVRHRSKYPAEPPVPPRVLMFSVGSCVVTCHRRRNPMCRAPH